MNVISLLPRKTWNNLWRFYEFWERLMHTLILHFCMLCSFACHLSFGTVLSLSIRAFKRRAFVYRLSLKSTMNFSSQSTFISRVFLVFLGWGLVVTGHGSACNRVPGKSLFHTLLLSPTLAKLLHFSSLCSFTPKVSLHVPYRRSGSRVSGRLRR